MKRLCVSFVIGANATGKSYFIQKHFSDKDIEYLNIYDYQESAYKDAGIDCRFHSSKYQNCLYDANLTLLTDIIEFLQKGRSVVVEHTLFKAKRRIFYIDAIRKVIDAEIEFFVMCPGDIRWKSFLAERKLHGNFQYHKSMVEEIQFPNPAEGIDRIFQVVDGDIQFRMETPTPEILPLVRKELEEESDRIHREDKRKTRHRVN